MADNLKRQRRDIPFVGGVLSDPVSQQTPVYYLENLLNHSSGGDGLTPRNGVEPFTALPTEETEGCVLFLVTLQDAPRTQLVVMMNADTKRVIHIDDYIEQEGRRAAPPSGGDYPAPIPIPSSNGLEFVTGTSVASLGEEVNVTVAGLESGGTCNWVALFSDDSSFYELDNGTVTASGSSSGTISFELPNSADGSWSVTIYLYNPSGEVGLFHTTLHTITEAVGNGLWTPLIVNAFNTPYLAINFLNESSGEMKGLILQEGLSNSGYAHSWRMYNTPMGYYLCVMRYTDNTLTERYVDFYSMSSINSAANNGVITPSMSWNINSPTTGTDYNLDGDGISAFFSVSRLTGSGYYVDSYYIHDGAYNSTRQITSIDTSGLDINFCDMSSVRSYAGNSTQKYINLVGILIPALRTLASGVMTVKRIAGDVYVYKNDSVAMYYNTNDTYGADIPLPSGIDFSSLSADFGGFYTNTNVRYDGTDVVYCNDEPNKILIVNVLGDNIFNDSVRYKWVDLPAGYSYPCMLGFNNDGSKFYCMIQDFDNGGLKLMVYNFNTRSVEIEPIVGGTDADFTRITDGTYDGSMAMFVLNPLYYGNGWVI